MMRSCLTVMMTASLVLAAPDPQPSEPTRWAILLRLPNHPLFNAAQRANIARELTAALQPGLGLLGNVDVIDAASAKADGLPLRFSKDGWPALELNAEKPLDGVKW